MSSHQRRRHDDRRRTNVSPALGLLIALGAGVAFYALFALLYHASVIAKFAS